MMIAVFAGAVVPFQAGANSALSKAIGHPLWASIVSSLVCIGATLPVLFAMRVPAPDLAGASTQPVWAWAGRIAGAIYITAAMILAPRLGTAGFLGTVVAGQMVAAAIIDNFGLMNLPVRPLNNARLAGICLVIFGVLVIQRKSLGAPP